MSKKEEEISSLLDLTSLQLGYNNERIILRFTGDTVHNEEITKNETANIALPPNKLVNLIRGLIHLGCTYQNDTGIDIGIPPMEGDEIDHE